MTDAVPPEELQPHPKNAEMYGEMGLSERFIEDVRENGIENPVAVTADSWFTDDGTLTLISGHRRRAAAAQTDHEVPIGERLMFESADEELDTVLRYNDQRKKAFSQRMGEADAIREVERRAATDRQGERTDLVENLPEGESGRSRDEIADRIGLGSGRTYQKAREVWDAAQDGDPTAEQLVDELDDGDESIHGAYTTLRDIEEFSTNDRLADLLGELVADGQLTDEDVRRLKAKNPGSVVGWLSTEHGIMPVADGMVPHWELDGTNVKPLEVGTVPVESVHTDWIQSLFHRDSVDNERLGLLARLYKKDSRGIPFQVAPASDGEFEFVEKTELTAFKACELIGDDTVPVDIVNVDGTDREAVEAFAGLRAITEGETFREPIANEDFEHAVNQVEDPKTQQLFRRLRALGNDEYSPPSSGDGVLIPRDE